MGNRMSTLDDLERVERALRDDASPHLGDGWSLHRKRQADTIAAYIAAQRAWLRQPSHYAYRYADGYIRFSGGARVNGQDPIESIALYALPEPPKESIDDWPRHIDGLEREPPKENPNG